MEIVDEHDDMLQRMLAASKEAGANDIKLSPKHYTMILEAILYWSEGSHKSTKECVERCFQLQHAAPDKFVTITDMILRYIERGDCAALYDRWYSAKADVENGSAKKKYTQWWREMQTRVAEMAEKKGYDVGESIKLALLFAFTKIADALHGTRVAQYLVLLASGPRPELDIPESTTSIAYDFFEERAARADDEMKDDNDEVKKYEEMLKAAARTGYAAAQESLLYYLDLDLELHRQLRDEFMPHIEMGARHGSYACLVFLIVRALLESRWADADGLLSYGQRLLGDEEFWALRGDMHRLKSTEYLRQKSTHKAEDEDKEAIRCYRRVDRRIAPMLRVNKVPYRTTLDALIARASVDAPEPGVELLLLNGAGLLDFTARVKNCAGCYLSDLDTKSQNIAVLGHLLKHRANAVIMDVGRNATTAQKAYYREMLRVTMRQCFAGCEVIICTIGASAMHYSSRVYHAQLGVIDLYENTLYFYDPNGHTRYSSLWNTGKNTFADIWNESIYPVLNELPRWGGKEFAWYEPPEGTINLQGQAVSEKSSQDERLREITRLPSNVLDLGGYCSVWSVLMAYLCAITTKRNPFKHDASINAILEQVMMYKIREISEFAPGSPAKHLLEETTKNGKNSLARVFSLSVAWNLYDNRDSLETRVDRFHCCLDKEDKWVEIKLK